MDSPRKDDRTKGVDSMIFKSARKSSTTSAPFSPTHVSTQASAHVLAQASAHIPTTFSARFSICALFLALFCIFIPSANALPLCQTQAESIKLWAGNIMQILSFQAGFTIAPSTLDSPISKAQPQQSPTNIAHHTRYGYTLGANLGVNYMNPERENIDYGWRIKYAFSRINSLESNSHHLGALVYIHPFPSARYQALGAIKKRIDCIGRADGYPTPFSFIFGSGLAIATNHLTSSKSALYGGYIELGVALFKWFPLNSEILYRISFYPKNSYFIDEITHSINIVFNVL